MALEHHSNHKMRFDQQVENSRNYVIPFILETMLLDDRTRVLEIGCGEGGVLQPFADRGCSCLGVDLDQLRIDLAEEFLADYTRKGRITVMNKNIMDDDFQIRWRGFFDLIVLKDVFEHIHDKEFFIAHLRNLLKPEGQIFFGFPPWYMPFGGHQQIAKKALTSKLPYYHILPSFIYGLILRLGGESKATIDELLDIKKTGISIERFEFMGQENGFKIFNQRYYLINPIYKYKFGLKPREQLHIIEILPFIRNFFTTCVYYTLKKI